MPRNLPSISFGNDVQVFSAEVRAGDRIDATLKAHGSAGALGAQVWRICPFGLEVIWPAPELPAIDAPYDIALTLRETLVHIQGVVTATLPLTGGRHTVALRFCTEGAERDPAHDRRQNVRWNCPVPFAPTGVATNPLQFRDTIYFTVLNISAEGIEFATSLRNKHLIPGIALAVQLTLPGLGVHAITLQVLHVHAETVGEKPMLCVGCKFVNARQSFLGALGQYLLMFGAHQAHAPTLQELKDAGMLTRSLGHAVSFTWVRSEEDYHEVLKLRHLAFADVSVDPTLDDVNQWSDVFDSRARILLAKYRGEPIGTMRLIYNDSEDSMEVERFVTLPPGFHSREEIVEIGRLCIHPKYRHSDLVLYLFVFLGATMLRSGRRYMLANGSERMVRTYIQFGCRPLGLTFVHNIDQKPHHVVFGDLHRMVVGADVGPFVWNVLLKDLWAEFGRDLALPITLRTRVRLFFYRLLAPLTNLAFERLRMKRLR